MRQPLYLKNVVTLALDEEKCNGCRACEKVCPQGVMQRAGKKAQIVNRDACMECGACVKNCETEALTVRAGVGCAGAIINGFLGSNVNSCDCVVDPKDLASGSGNCCG
jgi:ferredoxin